MPLDRTLGLLRHEKLLRNKWSMNSIGITPTSLHRSERTRLHVLSAKSQQIEVATELPTTIGSWQGFRFLSAVDETTIPEPAVPVRRHQLNHSSSGHYRDRFRANAFRMSMTTGEWNARLRREPYQYQRECHENVAISSQSRRKGCECAKDFASEPSRNVVF